MANVTESIMDEVKQFMMMFMSAAVGEIYNLSQASVAGITSLLLKKENLKALSDNGGEATLKEFQKALKKGEGFSSLRVNDSMLEDYKRFMNNHNVMYVSMNDVQNDTHVFMFRNRDIEKVQEIKKLVNTIHLEESELPPKTFMDAYENRKIAFVSNLSAEEVELFRYFMKPEHAKFSVIDNGKGSYMVTHDSKDRAVVREALQRANWTLRGNFGERVKEQVSYRIKGRQEVVLDLEDAEKEFYIVSKTNPKNFVHVTENQVSYYKNEQEIAKVYRNDTDFKPTAWDMIESISSPTIFKAEEFHADIRLRQEMIEKKLSLDEFPSDMIIEEEMKKYNRLRDLVSQKMGLDNENQGNWALYVDSVSYSEYSTYENVLDNDAEKAMQMEFERLKSSVKTTEETHVHDELEVEEKSLDYIIDRAERRVQENQENKEKSRAAAPVHPKSYEYH